MRRRPVVGDLRSAVPPDQLGTVLQQRGEAGVQPGMLTGQQVVVDHLAQQRVTEAVSGLVGGQHGGVDRLAQSAIEVDARRIATASSSS